MTFQAVLSSRIVPVYALRTICVTFTTLGVIRIVAPKKQGNIAAALLLVVVSYLLIERRLYHLFNIKFSHLHKGFRCFTGLIGISH
jgi:hypothetical protein